MALIKTTAVIDEISGKVQGSVFASNKGGAYIRGRGLVTNPRSVQQAVVRSIFTDISQRWRTLTEANRDSWNTSAADFPYQNRLGDTKTLSGKSLFQKLNLNLFMIGQPQLANCPAPVAIRGFNEPAPDFSVTVDGSGNLTAMDFDWAIFAESVATMGTAYLVEATPGLSAGIKNASNRYRRIGVIDDPGAAVNAIDQSMVAKEAGTASPEGMIACYQAVFGNPQSGEKVFIRIKPVNVNSGQAAKGLESSAVNF